LKNHSSIIEIVCIGNYCRSPVAENILQEKFKNLDITVRSSGISPVNKVGMDTRSHAYLKDIGLEPKQHFPTKITFDRVASSSIILALDIPVLVELNKAFPFWKKKIKLLSHANKRLDLSDPIGYGSDDYKEVMKNIKLATESINLELI
tara:strand:- start:120 stop:566 length:447 start_codon:yes stop_codon:yes gene_type:complete